MSKISNAFIDKAKIAYLTADIGIDQTGANCINNFIALAQGGANILEIGIPFSDPVADGEVIQKAMQQALSNGTSPQMVLNIVSILSKKVNTALILFTYFNPIQLDPEEFLIKAKIAGVEGILVVDLPFEESREFKQLCDRVGLSFIPVASPSTDMKRIKLLTKATSGFLYYVCRDGITGIKKSLPEDLLIKIKKIQANSNLKIVIGFGISNNQMVREVLSYSDGCVIGSYFVKELLNGAKPDKLRILAQDIFTLN